MSDPFSIQEAVADLPRVRAEHGPERHADDAVEIRSSKLEKSGAFKKGKELGAAEHEIRDPADTSVNKHEEFGYTSDEDITAFRAGYMLGRLFAAASSSIIDQALENSLPPEDVPLTAKNVFTYGTKVSFAIVYGSWVLMSLLFLVFIR